MPNRRYEQGRRFEYKSRDLYRDRGYYAERQYGSYGDFDVYAVHPSGKEVVFISVKSFKKKRGSYQDAIRKLRRIPAGSGVRREIHIWGPIKRGVATPLQIIEV